jgi:hypothetical protein
MDFYQLALDWVLLHRSLPRPIQAQGRSSKYREYGHPAQWASDKLAQIAGLFYSWHDLLAEERNETPPRPKAAEVIHVVKAWQYLEPRFDQLVNLVDRDDLREITELHREIRNALGYSKPRELLPIPCPGCELRTLTRTIAVGKDYISCGQCGYSVAEEYYPHLVRVAIDTLIESM